MKNKDFEKALKNKYPDCDFYIKTKNDEEIEILYNNKNYINNDEFLDNILDIGKDYLTEDELWNVVTTYDLYKEIPKFELQLFPDLIKIKNVLVYDQIYQYTNMLEEINNVFSRQQIPKVSIIKSIMNFVYEKISYIGIQIIPVLTIEKNENAKLNYNYKSGVNYFSSLEIRN